MSGQPIAEVFQLTAELCLARGVHNIVATPGLTELQVDDTWAVTINPHEGEPIDGVPFGCMAFTYNGWPAGLVDPTGGPLAAGTWANEDTLVSALREAIEAAGGSKAP